MKKWKIFAGISALFVLGVLIGSLGTGLYFKHRFIPLRDRDPSARKAFIMKKLSRELNLTEAQKTKFESIIDQVQGQRQEFFKKTHPQIRQIMNEGFLKMKAELRADQQKKFDELRQRWEARKKVRGRPHFHR